MHSVPAGCLFLFVLVSAPPAAPADSTAPAPELSRPREPWVFRCVLDKHPRMVVAALHQSLWVAYDATDCTFYKAWDGDVKFDGAVYTTVHGPQPTTRGESLLERPSVADAAWRVTRNGKPVDFKAVWKGYRLSAEPPRHVTLLYEIQLQPGGSVVRVEETPEAQVDQDGTIHLDRRFTTSGTPPGVVISLKMGTRDPKGDAIALSRDERPIEAADAEPADFVTVELDSSSQTRVVAVLRAGNAAPSSPSGGAAPIEAAR